MKYELNTTDIEQEKEKGVLSTALRRLIPLMAEEGTAVTLAILAILVNAGTTLATPYLIGRIVDVYIQTKNFNGVVMYSGILLATYVVGLIASYIQVKKMGGVGRRLLFNLRNKIFTKLQELPVAFFNQNKAGDVISRINNDTDKLNQFFAQALMQFISNFILIIGTAIFLLTIHTRLGLIALAPAVLALILTQLLSPWVKRTSLVSLRTLGAMSGEIQESINNFKVIVAFNRLDYFRTKFKEANTSNYDASLSAGVASNVFNPIYSFVSTLAQITVLGYGLYLVTHGSFTIGLLIGYILYVNSFYMPLRQLASVWSSLQLALAGLDRISEILALESNVQSMPAETSHSETEGALLEFKDVSFHYTEGVDVLRDINLTLLPGKTYALVGPTGGGKTTTASLMARLYDPTKGIIYLEGKDIRSYESNERTQKIGFILQEPFLFTGTVGDNIVYGNEALEKYTNEELMQKLIDTGLADLLARFSEGLATKVMTTGDAISLGQKQLIAFMRATLREPDLLILDEATANIDTVTEELLDQVLAKLPAKTTRVIIAHRLNTIQSADVIYFVNGGTITKAGSMQEAVDMLMHGKRQS